MKKKLWYFLTSLFILLCVGGYANNAEAATANPYRTDGTEAKYKGEIDADFFETQSSKSLRKDARGANYTLRKGIDVSHWQNDAGPIDWNAVKNSGVEFVIVKLGGRYNDGTMYEDPCYQKNIEGALAAGLRVGVYFWSEAITEAEAREEANFCISRIYKYNITMPICMDYEWCGTANRPYCRLYNSGQTPAQRTDVANAFMNQCRAFGYTGMLYANKSTLNNSFIGSSLATNGKVWVAQYLYANANTGELHHNYANVASNYEGVYDFHQFSSQGGISGITGYVDLDYWYDDGTIYGQDFSAVFDAEYYANKYPDLKKAYGNNASALLEHFITAGMNEKRQGCSTFNVESYFLRYPDLRQGYGTNWRELYSHYIRAGKSEGRIGTGCTAMVGATTVYGGVDYKDIYDYNYYINKYPDIKKAYGYNDAAVLEHFVKYGLAEGRQAISTFSIRSYRNRYPDLRQGYGNNNLEIAKHYIHWGKKEGRIATGCDNQIIGGVTVYQGVDYASVYNYNYYINRYADIKNAYGSNDVAVLEHFVQHGLAEGRQAISTFSIRSYRNRYPDLRQAYGNNNREIAKHYIHWGKKEGRVAIGYDNQLIGGVTVYQGVDYASVYDYNYYINRYADIKNAYGSNDVAVLEHFVNHGMSEGRQGNEQFNVGNYRKRYDDLDKAFGNDLKAYFIHYIDHGMAEGRTAK